MQNQWQKASTVDKAVVTIIDKYLEVQGVIFDGKNTLEDVIHLVDKWATKEHQANGAQSLTRRSLCVCIEALPNMLTQLERLEEQLPRRYAIRQVWESFGIDTPVINVSFDPTHTELHATLQKIKEEFEFLARFMGLVYDIASSEDKVEEAGLQVVFWRDVASTNGVVRKRSWAERLDVPGDIIDVPSAEVIKARWGREHQSLENVISMMTTFQADAHTHAHAREESTETATSGQKRKAGGLDVVKTSLAQLQLLV